MKTVFIGAGKMATALATAIVKSGLIDATDITASDILPQARKAFMENTGVNCVENVSLTQSLSPHRTDDICQLLLITSEVILVSQKHV